MNRHPRTLFSLGRGHDGDNNSTQCAHRAQPDACPSVNLITRLLPPFLSIGVFDHFNFRGDKRCFQGGHLFGGPIAPLQSAHRKRDHPADAEDAKATYYRRNHWLLRVDFTRTQVRRTRYFDIEVSQIRVMARVTGERVRSKVSATCSAQAVTYIHSLFIYLYICFLKIVIRSMDKSTKLRMFIFYLQSP